MLEDLKVRELSRRRTHKKLGKFSQAVTCIESLLLCLFLQTDAGVVPFFML
jgi:hypothetical protein